MLKAGDGDEGLLWGLNVGQLQARGGYGLNRLLHMLLHAVASVLFFQQISARGIGPAAVSCRGPHHRAGGGDVVGVGPVEGQLAGQSSSLDRGRRACPLLCTGPRRTSTSLRLWDGPLLLLTHCWDIGPLLLL